LARQLSRGACPRVAAAMRVGVDGHAGNGSAGPSQIRQEPQATLTRPLFAALEIVKWLSCCEL
jgi:hypothetical protein